MAADIRQGDWVRVTRTVTQTYEGRVLVCKGRYMADDEDGCRRTFSPDAPEYAVEVLDRPDPARVHQRIVDHGTVIVVVDPEPAAGEG